MAPNTIRYYSGPDAHARIEKLGRIWKLDLQARHPITGEYIEVHSSHNNIIDATTRLFSYGIPMSRHEINKPVQPTIQVRPQTTTKTRVMTRKESKL